MVQKQHRKLLVGFLVLTVLEFLAVSVVRAQVVVEHARNVTTENDSNKKDGNDENNYNDERGRGLKLNRIECEEPADCSRVEEAYCDVDLKICICKPDYPISDSKNCYKESKFGEFCRLDLQCQQSDKNARCNLDLNVCQCQKQFEPQSFSKGKQYWCVESTSTTNYAPGSHYDPALFGIMGGLILMFIVLCVVLQLFARAQFADNRSIFNTPNPRLMNVSLMKNSKFYQNSSTNERDRRSSSNRSGNSRKSRRESAMAAAAAAAAVHVGAQTASKIMNNQSNVAIPEAEVQQCQEGDRFLVLENEKCADTRKASNCEEGLTSREARRQLKGSSGVPVPSEDQDNNGDSIEQVDEFTQINLTSPNSNSGLLEGRRMKTEVEENQKKK